jgi:hypothetical protein
VFQTVGIQPATVDVLRNKHDVFTNWLVVQ